MLTVTVSVNGHEIARATAENRSDLAEVSDYQVVWSELASAQSGLPERANTFLLSGHRRRQSVWALVRKIADRAATGRDILGGK